MADVDRGPAKGKVVLAMNGPITVDWGPKQHNDQMATIAAAHPSSVLRAWPRHILLARRVAAFLSVLSVVTYGVAIMSAGQRGPVYLALALSACGAVLTLARPVPGLVLTVAACAVAVAVGAEPTTPWSVVVFALLSATLWGAPPVLVGGPVAVTLYVLLRLHEGGEGLLTPAAITAGSAAVAAAAVGGGIRAQWRYRVVLEQRA